MKKLLVLAVLVFLVTGLALAQTITGNTSYVPTTDVMGAHENGGRGCAGCHAPHSGGRGSGGVTVADSLPWSAIASRRTACDGRHRPLGHGHHADRDRLCWWYDHL